MPRLRYLKHKIFSPLPLAVELLLRKPALQILHFCFSTGGSTRQKQPATRVGPSMGNMRRPQIPWIWHPTGEAHGASQYPPPGTAQSRGDGRGLEQEAEPPILGSSPPPAPLAVGEAKDHCSGAAALVPQLSSGTGLFLGTSIPRPNLCRDRAAGP